MLAQSSGPEIPYKVEVVTSQAGHTHENEENVEHHKKSKKIK
jgi:hypothetical protein